MALIAMAACQSGRMGQEMPIGQPVETASGPPPPLGDDPHATVERLHADLVERRAALGLPAPPPPHEDACEPVCAVGDPPGAATASPGCTPGTGSACAATCAQADAVCDDAARICAIAKQTRTEAWVAGQCQEARATCTDAHVPCCGCRS
jgi:hypothetical protein